MEDNLTKCKLKQMKSDLYAILKNSTAQLLQAKNKSAFMGYAMIVN
jgi:hypothetical protein